jgi:RNA-splicing ligase RtcB
VPTEIAPGVLSWASILDPVTREQAAKAATLRVVPLPVALMPDAHLGIGATVGSVIPTEGAIIPAAVGVDIGCGMVASETTLSAADLPDDLQPLLDDLERTIPAGMGRGHAVEDAGAAWIRERDARTGYTPEEARSGKELTTACRQFGTLGSGNHFIEVCLDERDRVWLMLHSGSRGAGNRIAQRHIRSAKGLMRRWAEDLPDPDLAYVVQGTPEFDAYLRDLLWAQDYAAGNRARMIALALGVLARRCAPDRRPEDIEAQRINCHHNYAAKEAHYDRELWITRKGAIRAREGDLGIIPGSMGARSYIVRGKGEPRSYTSCAHGAGRAMSRREARRRFSAEDLAAAMGERTWLRDRGAALVDEIPASYKDIDQVMEDQQDLVEVLHTLRQVVNYKGTESGKW